MSENVIELRNVHKYFGNVTALNGLNLTIKKGQIYALLGHNGAGKTTTLRIILGLLSINDGSVSVFGVNPLDVGEDIRLKAGVLSEDTGLYESLTVYDNLKFFAEIYNCKKDFYEKEIDSLLNEFEILDKKNSVIKDFSLGMKKKVAIIRTILHKPQLVLLDEPTNGLDPISIQKFHKIILDMAKNHGTSFIITTHNLDEVKKVCDQITIVKHGKSIISKNLRDDDFSDIFQTKIACLSDLEKSKPDVENILNTVGKQVKYEINNNVIVLKTIDKLLIASIVNQLSKRDIMIYEISKDEFDLEKIYLQTEMGEH